MSEPANPLISVPESGHRDVTAITTAEINSKKRRTAVSEIAMWLYFSSVFNVCSGLTDESYLSLRLDVFG